MSMVLEFEMRIKFDGEFSLGIVCKTGTFVWLLLPWNGFGMHNWIRNEIDFNYCVLQSWNRYNAIKMQVTGNSAYAWCTAFFYLSRSRWHKCNFNKHKCSGNECTSSSWSYNTFLMHVHMHICNFRIRMQLHLKCIWDVTLRHLPKYWI